MAGSQATTVEQYLAELPAERRGVVAAVRTLVRQHLPRGYDEGMAWGMITYSLPLARYPETYNGQPLLFAALAAQKNYYALYLMCAYMGAERERALRRAFRDAGKRLDMGKSCVRFRSLEDLPLEGIGRLIASCPPEAFIAAYEAGRAGAGRTRTRASHTRARSGKPRARECQPAARARPRRAARPAAKPPRKDLRA